MADKNVNGRYAVRYQGAANAFAWFNSRADALDFRDGISRELDVPYEAYIIETGQVIA